MVTYLQENIRQNDEQIAASDFPTDRGLRHKSRVGNQSYLDVKAFGAILRKKLISLGEDDLWVDVGAGDLWAQRDYILHPSFSGLPHARLAVLSAADPPTREFKENLALLQGTLGERFSYSSGRMIEETPEGGLPKGASLVSDLYAALTFYPQIDRTIATELGMLEPGGLLVGRLQKVFIEDNEGKKYGLGRYLRSIKGADLAYHGFYTAAFRRNSDEIQVPSLELVRLLSAENAPNPNGLPRDFVFCHRKYRLADGVPVLK